MSSPGQVDATARRPARPRCCRLPIQHHEGGLCARRKSPTAHSHNIVVLLHAHNPHYVSSPCKKPLGAVWRTARKLTLLLAGAIHISHELARVLPAQTNGNKAGRRYWALCRPHWHNPRLQRRQAVLPSRVIVKGIKRCRPVND